jgi:general secretion pathway protein G
MSQAKNYCRQPSHCKKNGAATRSRGFTLVEILIVVIILGILAAIVIPQFTNASTEARKNSLLSQIQTLRSQIQLFKLQHNDVLPDLVANQWAQLMSKTDLTGAVNAAGSFGPYLESTPKNPLNNDTTVAAAAGAGVGWIYDVTSGSLTATNQTDTLTFDESTGTVQ